MASEHQVADAKVVGRSAVSEPEVPAFPYLTSRRLSYWNKSFPVAASRRWDCNVHSGLVGRTAPFRKVLARGMKSAYTQLQGTPRKGAEGGHGADESDIHCTYC